MVEIGSHFYLDETKIASIEKKMNSSCAASLVQSQSKAYLMSGRAAIFHCLLDIKKKKEPRGEKWTALIPEYTCESIVLPFLEAGIKLYTYSIDAKFMVSTSYLNKKIRLYEPDILLFHPYFGFDTLEIDVPLEKEKLQVIDDKTQSFLTGLDYPFSDYTVCSYRKWGPIPDGALAESLGTAFEVETPELWREEGLKLLLYAYRHKEAYLHQGIGDKEVFLKEYARHESALDEKILYERMSPFSLFAYDELMKEVDAIKRLRQKNFSTLSSWPYWGKGVEPYFQLNDEVPLYFPIKIKDGRREELQGFLAEKKIYCPIIWPSPWGDEHLSTCCHEITKSCLCIPIDQRYSSRDMERILREFDSFFRNGR